jgi:flagellar hook-length control protein FliK
MADVPATTTAARTVAGANSSANTSQAAAPSLGAAAITQVSVTVSSNPGSANQGTGDGSGSSPHQEAAPAPSAFAAPATVSGQTGASNPTNAASAQGNGPQVMANDPTVPSPLPKPQPPASTSSHTVSSQPDPEPVAKVQAGSGETGVSNTLGQGDVLASAQAATSITSAGQAQQNQASPSQVPTSSASPPPSTQDSQAANAQPAITPHLVQSAQQAEMRVGVQPEGLGPIEIRATMHGEELGAAISAQQPETRQWLVNHLGELAYNLDSQNVRVSQLSVSAPSGGGSLSPDLSQSGSGHQAGQQQPQTVPQFGYDEPAGGTSGETDLISESYSQSDTRSGVDLRA